MRTFVRFMLITSFLLTSFALPALASQMGTVYVRPEVRYGPTGDFDLNSLELVQSLKEHLGVPVNRHAPVAIQLYVPRAWLGERESYGYQDFGADVFGAVIQRDASGQQSVVVALLKLQAVVTLPGGNEQVITVVGGAAQAYSPEGDSSTHVEIPYTITRGEERSSHSVDLSWGGGHRLDRQQAEELVEAAAVADTTKRLAEALKAAAGQLSGPSSPVRTGGMVPMSSVPTPSSPAGAPASTRHFRTRFGPAWQAAIQPWLDRGMPAPIYVGGAIRAYVVSQDLFDPSRYYVLTPDGSPLNQGDLDDGFVPEP